MKKKILVILVCMLVAYGSAFTVGASTSIEKQLKVTLSSNGQQGGTTLITDTGNDRVIEVDTAGTIVWEKTGLDYPVDAERLANGNTLIAEFLMNRLIEVDIAGTIVWEKTGLNGPGDAERLANGNTLIADSWNNRVIEVDTSGTIVWEKTGLNTPIDAERLANGNTLIAEFLANRVIEVNISGTIVWEKTGLDRPYDSERLENGNTLITDYGFNRVIEVDTSGIIVWEKTGLIGPGDAERLANGNTLIAVTSNNSLIEVDTAGIIVWEKTGLAMPWDVEEIPNEPPAALTINGKTSGKAGEEYEYTLNATDPEGDNIRYIINWGDNTSNTTGYNPSGTDVIVSHTWSNDGTYNITAKAQDVYGAESSEVTLTVNIPKSRAVNRPIFLWLFERFPNIYPILRIILRVS